MPKLTDKQAKAAETAEGGFKLVPDGAYLCELVSVKVIPGPTADQWEFTWKVADPDHDDNWQGVNLKDWVSLGEASAWKMRQVFDAMGYSLDSDTDEMVGDQARLYVRKGKQEQGKNAGTMRNFIDRYVDPAEDVDD